MARWLQARVGVAIGVVLLSGDAAGAAPERPVTLRLTVSDQAGVSRDAFATAVDAMSRIYAAAGVELQWTYSCVESCRSQAAPAPVIDQRDIDQREGLELAITIVPDALTPAAFPSGVMGSAPVGSRLVYVFLGRARAFAFQRDLSIGTVLGHIIAHEVGHLLLRQGHAAHGLMRATWDLRDLRFAKQGKFGFTAEQGVRIREYLSLRMSEKYVASLR
jgi:hypothetical protein